LLSLNVIHICQNELQSGSGFIHMPSLSMFPPSTEPKKLMNIWRGKPSLHHDWLSVASISRTL